MIAALMNEFLAATASPMPNSFASGGSMVLGRLIRKRAERARKIMLEELEAGRRNRHDLPEEDVAAVVYRYMRAATEGAARLNLRLMAAVASGQESGRAIYPDEFLRWADTLASLTRNEVMVLATVAEQSRDSDSEHFRSGNFWVDCKKQIERVHGIDDLTAEGLASALLRTGLLRILGGLLDIGQAYAPTDDLKRLYALIDIEGVVRRTDRQEQDHEPVI